jgi:Ca2+/Na+ antiporter
MTSRSISFVFSTNIQLKTSPKSAAMVISIWGIVCGTTAEENKSVMQLNLIPMFIIFTHLKFFLLQFEFSALERQISVLYVLPGTSSF